MGSFAPLFSKAVALRVAEPRGLSAHAISFLQSFFLCGSTRKEKSVKGLLIPKVFSRFSLPKQAQRKANKRKGRNTGLRAPYPRHYAWSGRFWKSDAKQSRVVSKNFSTNPNLYPSIEYFFYVCYNEQNQPRSVQYERLQRYRSFQ
jgi:hypothetical protein